MADVRCYSDFLQISEEKMTYRLALRFIYATYDINCTLFPATMLYFKLPLKNANIAKNK